MFFKELDDLVAEGKLAVVLGLVRDVFESFVHTGDAQAESAKTFLLFEIPILQKGVMDPFGAVAFEELDGLGDGRVEGM